MRTPKFHARLLVAPSVMLSLAGAFLFTGLACAQGTQHGFWTAPDADAAHSSWQKAETGINTETVAKDFKFLWKLKLGKETAKSPSFSEPLLYPDLITGKGFKDLALWADANTLYAVDSELGELVWQKDFKPSASKACGYIQVIIEPPHIIHFGAPRPAPKPGAAAPPPPPRPSEQPLPRSLRRVGVSPGGGNFGIRGVYVVTSDGYVHEQIMATGLDYAPPVKFLPVPGGRSSGLNISGKVLYTVSGTGCHNLANTVWSIDLNTPDYTVSSFKTQKLGLAGLTGPAIGQDGTAYVLTGSGRPEPPVYAASVMALDPKDLKVKDWYSPSASTRELNAGPVIFTSKEKELIAAPGKDGSLVLLDSQSLGGADHHTPLAQTGSLSRAAKRGVWEGLATAQDKSGVSWVFASISGAVEAGVSFASSNGPVPHGSIVAFKVEEQDGHMQLTPAWISRDLLNPAPPVVANGVVFALESGSNTAHAILYALDAGTGKQLYSSGDAIQTYAHLAGMSVGDGHVFFTTHDNTLYSFGIPLEH
jgi:outer membrane protein assembly factor BamB